jgi:hypothetical protein
MSKYVFDINFYCNFYPDLNDFSGNNAFLLKHYKLYGIKENRICCRKELNDIINKNLLLIEEQKIILTNYDYKKSDESKLNILIRTSMRPEYFKTCIESVLSQNYTNYNIFICYDKKESFSYLENYSTIHNISIHYIEINSDEKYKFNLYNNFLMSLVNDGFILFLDDDDMFAHNNVLKIINENLLNDDTILLWKFMRPDKVIYPSNVENIQLGEIDTTSVCFHNKHKELSVWNDKKNGDYYFYSNLFKAISDLNSVNFKITELNFILIRTIFLDKVCNS